MGQRNFPKKDASASRAADLLVADIVVYLAQSPDDLARFFELSGLTPQSLRDAAAKPEFAPSLLDFICSDERLLRAFAADSGRDPSRIDALRVSLAPRYEGESG